MVKGLRKELLVAEMTAGHYYITSGLPENLGGRDEGPNPHELLEASLAACTILTAQLYADRKNMKLESTDCTVKILSEGAETKIAREVSFRGELSTEEKARLAEIVNKCPIHRLLISSVSIETTVV